MHTRYSLRVFFNLKEIIGGDTVKDEALRIMKMLDLFPNVIREFKEENKLNKSETRNGILYWLTDEEQEIVNQFQKEHEGTLVYHVILTNTVDFGPILDLLYVTENQEDWNLYKDYLKDDLVLSYSVTPFPEGGLIKVKKVNGGLVREY